MHCPLLYSQEMIGKCSVSASSWLIFICHCKCDGHGPTILITAHFYTLHHSVHTHISDQTWYYINALSSASFMRDDQQMVHTCVLWMCAAPIFQLAMHKMFHPHLCWINQSFWKSLAWSLFLQNDITVNEKIVNVMNKDNQRINCLLFLLSFNNYFTISIIIFNN